MQVKWKDGYSCSTCGHREYWLLSRKRIGCKKCLSRVSILSGTLFEQTNKSLMLWFRAIWFLISQKNGISAVGLQRIMGFGSYQTAWTWLHKLRLVTVLPERQKLSGTVEIDETLLGGKKEGKRGRGAEGRVLLVIAVEVKDKGTGRVRIGVVADASTKSLQNFITSNVDPGSEIVTDGWKPYAGIIGYKHTVADDKDATTDDCVLPNAHRIASLLKRWLLGTHQNYVKGKKTQNYLEEFTFRYNRRKAASRGLLFHRVLEQAIIHQPVSYSHVASMLTTSL